MIIYKTVNKLNGKIYIGQDTINNPAYFGSGILILKAIRKYGKSNFEKIILEICNSIDELNEREIFWIKKLNATDRTTGYNLHSGGKGMTDERRNNIGKSLKGRIFSEEHKKKIGVKTKQFHTGRKRSDATRKKLSDARKLLTPEQKQKIALGISRGKSGKPLSEEAKHKLSLFWKGKKKSAEHRANISAGKKKNCK